MLESLGINHRPRLFALLLIVALFIGRPAVSDENHGPDGRPLTESNPKLLAELFPDPTTAGTFLPLLQDKNAYPILLLLKELKTKLPAEKFTEVTKGMTGSTAVEKTLTAIQVNNLKLPDFYPVLDKFKTLAEPENKISKLPNKEKNEQRKSYLDWANGRIKDITDKVSRTDSERDEATILKSVALDLELRSLKQQDPKLAEEIEKILKADSQIHNLEEARKKLKVNEVDSAVGNLAQFRYAPFLESDSQDKKLEALKAASAREKKELEWFLANGSKLTNRDLLRYNDYFLKKLGVGVWEFLSNLSSDVNDKLDPKARSSAEARATIERFLREDDLDFASGLPGILTHREMPVNQATPDQVLASRQRNSAEKLSEAQVMAEATNFRRFPNPYINSRVTELKRDLKEMLVMQSILNRRGPSQKLEQAKSIIANSEAELKILHTLLAGYDDPSRKAVAGHMEVADPKSYSAKFKWQSYATKEEKQALRAEFDNDKKLDDRITLLVERMAFTHLPGDDVYHRLGGISAADRQAIERYCSAYRAEGQDIGKLTKVLYLQDEGDPERPARWFNDYALPMVCQIVSDYHRLPSPVRELRRHIFEFKDNERFEADDEQKSLLETLNSLDAAQLGEFFAAEATGKFNGSDRYKVALELLKSIRDGRTQKVIRMFKGNDDPIDVSSVLPKSTVDEQKLLDADFGRPRFVKEDFNGREVPVERHGKVKIYHLGTGIKKEKWDLKPPKDDVANSKKFFEANPNVKAEVEDFLTRGFPTGGETDRHRKIYQKVAGQSRDFQEHLRKYCVGYGTKPPGLNLKTVTVDPWVCQALEDFRTLPENSKFIRAFMLDHPRATLKDAQGNEKEVELFVNEHRLLDHLTQDQKEALGKGDFGGPGDHRDIETVRFLGGLLRSRVSEHRGRVDPTKATAGELSKGDYYLRQLLSKMPDVERSAILEARVDFDSEINNVNANTYGSWQTGIHVLQNERQKYLTELCKLMITGQSKFLDPPPGVEYIDVGKRKEFLKFGLTQILTSLDMALIQREPELLKNKYTEAYSDLLDREVERMGPHCESRAQGATGDGGHEEYPELEDFLARRLGTGLTSEARNRLASTPPGVVDMLRRLASHAPEVNRRLADGDPVRAKIQKELAEQIYNPTPLAITDMVFREHPEIRNQFLNESAKKYPSLNQPLGWKEKPADYNLFNALKDIGSLSIEERKRLNDHLHQLLASQAIGSGPEVKFKDQDLSQFVSLSEALLGDYGQRAHNSGLVNLPGGNGSYTPAFVLNAGNAFRQAQHEANNDPQRRSQIDFLDRIEKRFYGGENDIHRGLPELTKRAILQLDQLHMDRLLSLESYLDHPANNQYSNNAARKELEKLMLNPTADNIDLTYSTDQFKVYRTCVASGRCPPAAKDRAAVDVSNQYRAARLHEAIVKGEASGQIARDPDHPEKTALESLAEIEATKAGIPPIAELVANPLNLSNPSLGMPDRFLAGQVMLAQRTKDGDLTKITSEEMVKILEKGPSALLEGSETVLKDPKLKQLIESAQNMSPFPLDAHEIADLTYRHLLTIHANSDIPALQTVAQRKLAETSITHFNKLAAHREDSIRRKKSETELRAKTQAVKQLLDRTHSNHELGNPESVEKSVDDIAGNGALFGFTEKTSQCLDAHTQDNSEASKNRILKCVETSNLDKYLKGDVTLLNAAAEKLKMSPEALTHLIQLADSKLGQPRATEPRQRLAQLNAITAALIAHLKDASFKPISEDLSKAVQALEKQEKMSLSDLFQSRDRTSDAKKEKFESEENALSQRSKRLAVEKQGRLLETQKRFRRRLAELKGNLRKGTVSVEQAEMYRTKLESDLLHDMDFIEQEINPQLKEITAKFTQIKRNRLEEYHGLPTLIPQAEAAHAQALKKLRDQYGIQIPAGPPEETPDAKNERISKFVEERLPSLKPDQRKYAQMVFSDLITSATQLQRRRAVRNEIESASDDELAVRDPRKDKILAYFGEHLGAIKDPNLRNRAIDEIWDYIKHQDDIKKVTTDSHTIGSLKNDPVRASLVKSMIQELENCSSPTLLRDRYQAGGVTAECGIKITPEHARELLASFELHGEKNQAAQEKKLDEILKEVAPLKTGWNGRNINPDTLVLNPEGYSFDSGNHSTEFMNAGLKKSMDKLSEFTNEGIPLSEQIEMNAIASHQRGGAQGLDLGNAKDRLGDAFVNGSTSTPVPFMNHSNLVVRIKVVNGQQVPVFQTRAEFEAEQKSALKDKEKAKEELLKAYEKVATLKNFSKICFHPEVQGDNSPEALKARRDQLYFWDKPFFDIFTDNKSLHQGSMYRAMHDLYGQDLSYKTDAEHSMDKSYNDMMKALATLKNGGKLVKWSYLDPTGKKIETTGGEIFQKYITDEGRRLAKYEVEAVVGYLKNNADALNRFRYELMAVPFMMGGTAALRMIAASGNLVWAARAKAMLALVKQAIDTSKSAALFTGVNNLGNVLIQNGKRIYEGKFDIQDPWLPAFNSVLEEQEHGMMMFGGNHVSELAWMRAGLNEGVSSFLGMATSNYSATLAQQQFLASAYGREGITLRKALVEYPIHSAMAGVYGLKLDQKAALFSKYWGIDPKSWVARSHSLEMGGAFAALNVMTTGFATLEYTGILDKVLRDPAMKGPEPKKPESWGIAVWDALWGQAGGNLAGAVMQGKSARAHAQQVAALKRLLHGADDATLLAHSTEIAKLYYDNNPGFRKFVNDSAQAKGVKPQDILNREAEIELDHWKSDPTLLKEKQREIIEIAVDQMARNPNGMRGIIRKLKTKEMAESPNLETLLNGLVNKHVITPEAAASVRKFKQDPHDSPGPAALLRRWYDGNQFVVDRNGSTHATTDVGNKFNQGLKNRPERDLAAKAFNEGLMEYSTHDASDIEGQDALLGFFNNNPWVGSEVYIGNLNLASGEINNVDRVIVLRTAMSEGIPVTPKLFDRLKLLQSDILTRNLTLGQFLTSEKKLLVR